MPMRESLMQEVARAVVDGKDVDHVDQQLIAPASLSDDRKAALWLLAFALLDPDTRRRRAPAILGEAPPSTLTPNGD